jgi:outer membrane protein OmpA-like peptidoglycan-associated protein
MQSSPAATTYAALELKQAGDALQLANASVENHDSQDKVDKLTYVATQKIALTREVAKQKTAEAESAQSSKERDQLRLDQRTAEADRANAKTAQANMNTRIAEIQTIDAQRTAQAAQADAAAAQARNAQLQAQLSEMAAKKTERGMVITLGDVLFGTDLARLNADGMRSAQKLATLLQQNPKRTVLVEGFTDSTGTEPHNQALSERRANAVRSSLQELGVAPDRIVTRGYGESSPVAANDTAANRQLNRRVEIVLSEDNATIAPR